MAEEFKALIRDYRDGKISRRQFMRKAIAITGSLMIANDLLNRLAQPIANSAEIDPTEPAVLSHEVEFSGKAGPLFGYLARPTGKGKYPALIIIHANQGLNEYTRDIARRLAKENYVALAVDFLSRHGGTKKVNPKSEGLSKIRELAPWQAVAEDSDASYTYLRSLPDVRGDRLGLIGFCWGGEMTFSTVTEVRGLKAAVVFYGRSPQPFERMNKIQAPVLAHYGEKDPGVNQDIPATVEAMKKFGKSYNYKIYPGAQHGFHTDTQPERYHAEAAKEAWGKSLDFFKSNLQS
jgi:carboxymethylenebutenolidase